MDYKKQYLDPRWQKKRLEILNRDDFICQICMNNEDTLHVHHTYYVLGRHPWNYPNGCLITLCDSCHAKEHLKKDNKADLLSDIIDNAGFYECLESVVSSTKIFNICSNPLEIEKLATALIGYSISGTYNELYDLLIEKTKGDIK